MINEEKLYQLEFVKNESGSTSSKTIYNHPNRPYSLQILKENPIVVFYNKSSSATGFVDAEEFIKWHKSHPATYLNFTWKEKQYTLLEFAK